MKKGFKKFLGIAAVFSIFTGSVGIGASAYKFNAVPVASVPGMTDEEVKAMNLVEGFFLLTNEMVHTDYSQWDRYSSRAQGIARDLEKAEKNFGGLFLSDGLWKRNFQKHENWRRIDRMATELADGMDLDVAKRLSEWFDKIKAPLH